VDFYASLAALVNQPLPVEGALDSCNMLDALMGKDPTGRDELVTEGIGAKTVLRQGSWVFIPPYNGVQLNKNVGIEMGNMKVPQLYNLAADKGQIRNEATGQESLVKRMSARLEQIRDGNSTRPECG
jgi:hypothetical protein